MKLNRNKKILIGLLCLGLGFVLYKYFGNVVEGLKIKNYEFGMERVSNNLKNITNVDETIKNMKNPENVRTLIANINTAVDDVKLAHTTMVSIKEGFNINNINKKNKKNKNKNKKDQPMQHGVLIAPIVVPNAEPNAVPIAPLVPLTTEQQTSIKTAITKATTSVTIAYTLFVTVATENPIKSQELEDLSNEEKIVFSCGHIIGGLKESLSWLQNAYDNSIKI
jgi:hypothetical protein